MNKNAYNKLLHTKKGKESAISSLGNLRVIRGLHEFSLVMGKNPILEIGVGIGTITKILLKYYTNEIYCHELDKFCTKELMKLKKSNYKNALNRMKISTNLNDYLGKIFAA
jgi:16S rRNA A1518/A1519 N6-dimethyltransferase RsmA/KsgA/DIM1 with predicted DNA glycosylase/AP lyase activity